MFILVTLFLFGYICMCYRLLCCAYYNFSIAYRDTSTYGEKEFWQPVQVKNEKKLERQRRPRKGIIRWWSNFEVDIITYLFVKFIVFFCLLDCFINLRIIIRDKDLFLQKSFFKMYIVILIRYLFEEQFDNSMHMKLIF